MLNCTRLALPFALISFVGCTGGPTGSSGPDASSNPSTCTQQPENVRLQLCDVTTDNVLVACEGDPPSPECTRTVNDNAFCCPARPAPAERPDSGEGAPVTTVKATYVGACRPELTNNPLKRLSFFTHTEFTSGAPGKLELTLRPLRVVDLSPPPTVSSKDVVGSDIIAASTNVASDGRFQTKLGTVLVPGSAQPISGSDLEINGAFLDGRFAESKFCARLGGQLVRPSPAARTLDPSNNICQFVRVDDGDPMPSFTAADFTPDACPLD